MSRPTAPFSLNSKIESYLKGRVFSNNQKFQFDKKAFIYNRVELLENLMKDKVVLHFGCCDHEGLIEEKIERQSHLQVKIAQIAAKCIGIDIDRVALDKLKSLNVDNCYYYDIYKSNNPEIENESYDIVLLGEILEHIADPVAFLKQIKIKFKNAKEIIITVPNAFSSRNFYNIRKGIEEINTDHKYWFSPYTISKVVTEAGFTVDSIYFVDRSRISWSDKIVKWYYLMCNKNPFTSRKWNILKASGLVVISKY